MKIAFVYTGIAGYMTDCWRALGSLPDVELRVWLEDMKAYRFNGNREVALRGIDVKWEYSEYISTEWLEEVESEMAVFKPDVVFVCGWSRKLPPFISKSKKLANIPMVLMLDMPWEWTLRKIAARFILHNRLRRFCMVFVPGASTATYAQWLGFQRTKIIEGAYCIDLYRFSDVKESQCKDSRKDFLYIGRKAHEKGLDVLQSAYDEYKKRGGSWNLKIPDFIEPADIPSVMHGRSCLVLPSRWEPWGVVVLEAIAAGMKTIVSDCVGARLDLPVDEVFRSGDVAGLAEAMLRIERLSKKRDDIDLSKYNTDSWTRRVVEICERCQK